MTLRFHSSALLDIRQAIAWYEAEKLGLGKRFNFNLNNTLRAILKSPLQFPVIFEDFRKARLSKPFPFKVIYMIHEDDIYVVAVAHDKRDPEMWKDRT